MYRRFNVHASQLRRFRARAETDWDAESDAESDAVWEPEIAPVPMQVTSDIGNFQEDRTEDLTSVQQEEVGQVETVTGDETGSEPTFLPTSPPQPTTRSGRRITTTRNGDFAYY